MFYSIDTNIALGILNKYDRLHELSVSLIKRIRGDLIIVQTVVNEICKVYPDKVYDAIKPFIDLYRSLILALPPESEIEKREEALLNDLLKNHPRMANFYKLALETARKQRAKNGLIGSIYGLMDYYMRIGKCSNLITLLKKIVKDLNSSIKVYAFGFDYILEFDSQEELKEFVELVDQVKKRTHKFWSGVKKSKDFEIFVEFVAMFAGELKEPAVFITDDKDFVKCAKKSLEALKDFIDISNLSFYQLNDFLNLGLNRNC